MSEGDVVGATERVPDKITAMDDAALIALAADLESDRVERTVSSNDGDKFREAVCAFANDMPDHRLPGVLFVGLRDDGTCGNVPITDQLLQNLASIHSDGNVVPFPSLVVQKRTLNGCEIAVVIVQPSYDPPVRFKGRVSIRVGPRRATASPEEERRLIEKRRSRDVPFDLLPVRSATLDDLNLELFEKQYLPSAVAIEVIEKNNRSVEQQLLSLRFLSLDRDSGEMFPTVTGLIVAGREPRDHVPGAYIQFIRFAGTLLTDPIKDNKEIAGPLSEMIQRLDEVFRAHIGVQTEFKSGTVETRRPDYPLVALQQIARNAIMHRNYEGTNASDSDTLVRRQNRGSESRRPFWTSKHREFWEARNCRLSELSYCRSDESTWICSTVWSRNCHCERRNEKQWQSDCCV